ncbi:MULTISPECIES: hypothetical protein [Alteribacter]|uniref:Uncharacterized protein n=1 Tax=Alteribacter keqinensis TaxID=2483800 RepID=A0A3M7TZE5_9BACI|nr:MULTISPECIES: hypothetical protein [Alteribacter]MBM7097648.1 hypothetical protein [Alteribacter salitolerans]RNA70134.1 hypothetical protein EBO34_09455 [Alteribacter keqinensis]
MSNKTRIVLSFIGSLLVLGVGIYRLAFEGVDGGLQIIAVVFVVVGVLGTLGNISEWKKVKTEETKRG